jgi:GNAT superfamily N-acetyltransferase
MPSLTPGAPAVRMATGADVDAVVRLGHLMFESMGLPDTSWMPRATEVLHHGIEEGRMAAFVIDDPEVPGRLVSSGVGILMQRMPSPSSPQGVLGYVQYVFTEPGFRGRGLARQVMESLLDWLEGAGVSVVELNATPAGEPLYRAMGFWEASNANLQLRLNARHRSRG